jgi:hypothetical protein
MRPLMTQGVVSFNFSGEGRRGSCTYQDGEPHHRDGRPSYRARYPLLFALELAGVGTGHGGLIGDEFRCVHASGERGLGLIAAPEQDTGDGYIGEDYTAGEEGKRGPV